VDIAISSRKTQVSSATEEVIREKIGKLGRFIDGMDRAEVHFFEEKNPRLAAQREVCEVTMSGHGHHVRCKAAAPDVATAVDLAVNKLEHQLHKLKTRLQRRLQGAPVGANAAGNGLGTEFADPQVVKVKRFAMQEMSYVEAAEHMELLGHDFYLFTSDVSGGAAVVYRRDDGELGVIEHEV
jgi:putative sigma-54 modulation protein